MSDRFEKGERVIRTATAVRVGINFGAFGFGFSHTIT